jgi:hypothetical protein
MSTNFSTSTDIYSKDFMAEETVLYYIIRFVPLLLITFFSRLYVKRRQISRTTLINLSGSRLIIKYIQIRFKNFQRHAMSSEETVMQPDTLTTGHNVLWIWDYYICGTRFYIEIQRESSENQQHQQNGTIISVLYEGEFPVHRILHVKSDGLYIDNILTSLWHNSALNPPPFDARAI